MKTTLSGIADTAEETKSAPAPASTAVVPQADAQVVNDRFFSNAEMEGDFDRSDVKTPKLNLTQAVGPLSAVFTPGEWVYNKDTSLGNRPLELTLLKLRKYFIEDIVYNEGTFPDIVATEREYMAKGGRPIREKWAMEKQQKGSSAGHVFYKPALDATVLIRGNKDDVFPFEYEGNPYAVAVWTLTSTGYSKTGTTLITAATLGLRTGLSFGLWTVTPKREKVGNNWVWIPYARQTGKNPPAFAEWGRSLIGS